METLRLIGIFRLGLKMFQMQNKVKQFLDAYTNRMNQNVLQLIKTTSICCASFKPTMKAVLPLPLQSSRQAHIISCPLPYKFPHKSCCHSSAIYGPVPVLHTEKNERKMKLSYFYRSCADWSRGEKIQT